MHNENTFQNFQNKARRSRRLALGRKRTLGAHALSLYTDMPFFLRNAENNFQNKVRRLRRWRWRLVGRELSLLERTPAVI